MKKGQTTIPILAVISTLFAWSAGLSIAAYNSNGSVSSLTASVGDIKETLDRSDLPSMKAEVDFMARQRGYNLDISEATTSNI